MSLIIGSNQLVDVKSVLDKAGAGDRMKVGELGCGAIGYFVFAAASLVGKEGKVYAVDIMKTALETIRRRAKQENISNVTTVWSNLEIFNATKIESGSLDVCLLINTLYHSHKRAAIVREAVRMMKKKARLLIVEWKKGSAPLGPPAEERVEKEALITAAPKLGLQLDEEFEAGQYHYGLLFTKI